jgi:DNA-binding CsgD family transcriptional regulator
MTDWPEHLWHNPGSARENGKMAMLDGGESDRQAILRLIEDETAAFWNKDWEAFEKCWVHEPYLRRVGWWSLGGVTYREGWEEFARLVQARFRDNPEPNRSAVEVRRENFNLRVGADMAWVTYDQYAPDTGEAEMDMPGLSRETRFLEKHDGAWRFAYSCYLFRSVHQETAPLLQVDKSGVVVWRNAGAARELARGCGLELRAGRLRATRRDDDARLQGALRWAASLAEDLESRRGVVPIVMQADADAVADVCWVTADSGLVFVAINDAALAGERLEAAALAYGLSAAQMRLAERIVAGEELPAAARTLGVSVNTVRTQLQRIFDKIGVRSQPALVRVLLSIASPAV